MTAAKRTLIEQGAEPKNKVTKQKKAAAHHLPSPKDNALSSASVEEKRPKKSVNSPKVKSLNGKTVGGNTPEAKSAPTKDTRKPSAKKSKNPGNRAASPGPLPPKTKTAQKSVHLNKTQTPQSLKKVQTKKKYSSSKPHPAGKKKSSSKKNSRALEFPTTTWGTDSVISFEDTEHLPPMELTSIAGGFVFHKDNVVLANIPGRGWEIIGGRIDLGEMPEDTFRREAMSQIGVTLAHVKMLGVIRIEHFGPEPPNCPYPFPVGYGVQYIGIVEELQPFNGSSESLGRSLISMEGFKEHYYDWNEYFEAVFKYACDVYNKWRKKLKL